MEYINAFEINGVLRTTAKQIAEMVKTLTGNPEFFKEKDKDSNHYDTAITREFKKLTETKKKNGMNLTKNDFQTLKEDDNEYYFDRMCAYGWIEPADYKRFRKLNVYSLYAAEVAIRSLSKKYDFRLSNHVHVHLEMRTNHAVLVDNEIWNKYNKNPSPLKAFTRKIILPKTQAVMEAEQQAEEIFSRKRFTRAYNGNHILDKFPEYEKETIRFYSTLCKAVRVFRESLVKSGIKDVDVLVDNFVIQKVQDYYKEEK
jgi:hypothetical protein